VCTDSVMVNSRHSFVPLRTGLSTEQSSVMLAHSRQYVALYRRNYTLYDFWTSQMTDLIRPVSRHRVGGGMTEQRTAEV
jgi:hypothetical protein